MTGGRLPELAGMVRSRQGVALPAIGCRCPRVDSPGSTGAPRQWLAAREYRSRADSAGAHNLRQAQQVPTGAGPVLFEASPHLNPHVYVPERAQRTPAMRHVRANGIWRCVVDAAQYAVLTPYRTAAWMFCGVSEGVDAKYEKIVRSNHATSQIRMPFTRMDRSATGGALRYTELVVAQRPGAVRARRSLDAQRMSRM